MQNKMKIRLRQVSDSTSEATIRGHQVLIDRPVTKAGTDSGPMGGELFLAAVAVARRIYAPEYARSRFCSGNEDAQQLHQ